ncbi:MAG: hypothetical protein AVDCRST_MAG64-3104, partial [uncultured Phycisphaerae bacterium]
EPDLSMRRLPEAVQGRRAVGGQAGAVQGVRHDRDRAGTRRRR